MPVGEPMLHVECDKCGYVSDPYSLTRLAGGGWDSRNIEPKLKREGWKVDGTRTICSECVEDGHG